MTNRYGAFRAKIFSYLAISATATLIYLAIAFWDTSLNWKFLGAGIFSFIIFAVAMLLWDEEETQETNEIERAKIDAVKMEKTNALPAQEVYTLPKPEQKED